MKKYAWLVLILCLALLAGCGIVDDPKPTATPDKPSQSTTEPEPVESEPPTDGINPEPPDLADRKPVESREPAVIVVPDEDNNRPPEVTDVPENTSAPESGDSSAQQAIDALRADAAGNVLAVGYLGYVEGGYTEVMDYLADEGYFVRYPFLEEMGKDRFCENAGGEIYIVLPVDPSAYVWVNTYDMTDADGYGFTKGSELYSGKGQPVLLKGNVSDIMANLRVTVTQNGKTVEYSPYLSLENGKLGVESGIYDCSPYELIKYPAPAAGEFCGEWYGREKDSTGELRALKLILEEDGSAHFNYGVPYREVLEVFEGSWRAEGDILTLTLYGGPISDDGTYEYDYCRDIEVKFRWEMQGVALVCEPWGGDSLMPGTYGEWYTFRPFDSFMLSGTWSADGGYCLQLKENGGCTYSITDASGSLLAEYDGWWSYRIGQIMLSVNMCGGSRYEAGERGQIAGTYKEEHNALNEMLITHISGTSLTDGMENDSSVIFKKQ